MYLIKLHNGIIQNCQKILSKEEAQWRFPEDFLKKCVYSENYLPVGYRYINGQAVQVVNLENTEEEETPELEEIKE